MVDVTVLLIVGRSDGLVDTVRSLDLQTLPHDSYSVLLVLTGSDEDLARRARSLEGRRPNVRVVEAPAGAGRATTELLDGLPGGVVLPLSLGQRLHRESLERLVGAATDAAVVLGRVSGSSPATTDPVNRSGESWPFVAAPAALSRDAAAAVADTAPDWVEEWRGQVLQRAGDVTHLAEYAPVRGGRFIGSRTLEVRGCDLAWEDTRLTVAVRLEADPEGAPAGATFVLFEVVSGLEYLVPAELVTEGGDVVVTGAFDPGDVALGAPLPDGEWLVGLELVGPAGSVRVQLPNQDLVPAIVHGRPVVRTLSRPRLALQVGRVRRNFITADPGDAKITESVAGTRLELPLRDLHLAGSQEATGSIVLGRLPVRADILGADGSPRLEAWLSGLAGSYRLGTRFGEGRATQTGLVLKVDGEGRMRLVSAAERPAAPAHSPAHRKASLVHRLRRAVPDPVAKALGRRGGR